MCKMKNFSRLWNILFYSLVRQDSPVDMSGVDISGFHPPWHSMQEFQLRKTKSLSQNSLFLIEMQAKTLQRFEVEKKCLDFHFSHL